jgi:hypothetical protein
MPELQAKLGLARLEKRNLSIVCLRFVACIWRSSPMD